METSPVPPLTSPVPIRVVTAAAPRSASRPAPPGQTVTTTHPTPIRARSPAADTSNTGMGQREPISGAKWLATERSVSAPPSTASR